MNSNDLQGCLTFLREAERLKSVLRSAFTSTGQQESTAEHSWRLCLMAMVFSSEFPELNLAKVLKLCVLHDLGEAIHGDVPAIYQAQTPNKSEQERTDLKTLMHSLPKPLFDEFMGLWEEYEAAASPEHGWSKGWTSWRPSCSTTRAPTRPTSTMASIWTTARNTWAHTLAAADTGAGGCRHAGPQADFGCCGLASDLKP